MKIYLDVLIITNAVITIVYIKCISKITHYDISKLRAGISSIIGGVASLLVIAQSDSFIKSALIAIIKIAVSSLIVLIAFKVNSIKKFIRYIFLYFFMNLIFTGICFIIWQAVGSSIIYIKNFTVYFNISLLHMTVATILIYCIISIYEWLLYKKFSLSESYKAIYSIGDYQLELPAISDSGNRLCDPFTATPVVIFCCNELYDHFNLDNDRVHLHAGFRLTPCSTISGESVIPITSKGKVTITDSRKNSKVVKCCVGITRNENQKARAIFNPDLLS